jgi:hypothetical protein
MNLSIISLSNFILKWILTMTRVLRTFLIYAIRLLSGAVTLVPANAEMTYAPSLPQFGGNNFQALEILKFEKAGSDAEKARIAAALAAADRAANATVTTNADRLVAAISNYLNVEIARRFSLEILDGTQPSGNFKVGDVTIGYTRSDGILSLVISDVNGSTAIELPVVN